MPSSARTRGDVQPLEQLTLLFTAALVLSAPPTGRRLLADLYLGRRENPRWHGGTVDAKMWLDMAGAVLLELNVLSFAAHQDLVIGHLSAAVALSAGLLTYFVVDYLTFEQVHLYTYDLFAEREGFKLGWGCLVFYPYGERTLLCGGGGDALADRAGTRAGAAAPMAVRAIVSVGHDPQRFRG